MYYIEVPSSDSVLIFSREEYQTTEVRLCASTEYNVALKPGQNDAPASPAPATAKTSRPRQKHPGPRQPHHPPTKAPQPRAPPPPKAAPQPKAALSQKHPPPGARPPTKAPRPPFSALGSWRGAFELRPGVEIPFNFDIRTDKSGQLKAFFRNGTESFEGGPVRQTTDSLFILIDQFDNELAFKIGEGPLTGTFSKQDRTGTPLPVKIEPNTTTRFTETNTSPGREYIRHL